MGAITDIVKAGVEPISKLIDVASRGIGTLYEPVNIRRIAKAKAFEMTTIAQAIRDNSDLPIFYGKDGVQIDSTDVKALAERASSRLMLQEMRKQQNIESIVDKAYENLQTETEVSSEPVNDDWVIRFFNSVEDVSDDFVQKIWASILAGEVKRPSSFSIRTLDSLKNISRQEAEFFERITYYTVKVKNRYILPCDFAVFKNNGIRYDEFRILDECGLIDLNNLTSCKIELDASKYLEIVTHDARIQIVNISESKETFKIKCITLTTIGQDLLKALRKEEKINSLDIENIVRKQKFDRKKFIIRTFHENQ